MKNRTAIKALQLLQAGIRSAMVDQPRLQQQRYFAEGSR